MGASPPMEPHPSTAALVAVSAAADSQPKADSMIILDVVDLAVVAYSAGTVFNELSASRNETENFLRSGDLEGITSRSDVALLQDLRDVSQFIIDNRHSPIDHAYVREVNARITRSGPLDPGQYRTHAQQIGVNTQHGRHEPKPVNDVVLQRIVDTAMALSEAREQALELFVQIANAQSFEDGNKRTALFVANSVPPRAFAGDACCACQRDRRSALQRAPRLGLCPGRSRRHQGPASCRGQRDGRTHGR